MASESAGPRLDPRGPRDVLAGVEAAAALLGVHGAPGWSKGRARRQPRLEAPNHGFARRALDARVPTVVMGGLNVGKERDGLTAGGLRRSIGTAQKFRYEETLE